MPEGDTILRTAQVLHAALSGTSITRFATVLPQLSRVDVDQSIVGRCIEAVTATGKHLLMRLSGDLVLHTHMRMHGSWHIYRPGEAWQLPQSDMRIVIGTEHYVAVGFRLPIAEFLSPGSLARHRTLPRLGPDLLAADCDVGEIVRRVRVQADQQIANVLLMQSVMAGIGNVFKSEVLFVARRHPFTVVHTLSDAQIEAVIGHARRLLRTNVGSASGDGFVPHAGWRRTTRDVNPASRLWVYGRQRKPCRICGHGIVCARQSTDARLTFWCESCQPAPLSDNRLD